MFLDKARNFLAGELGSAGSTPPFNLHWGFQAFLHYYDAYHQDGRPENRQALTDLEKTFRVLEGRWRLAGRSLFFFFLAVQLIEIS